MKKVKVCGINNNENSRVVDSAQPDFMGFIFYNKSSRCVQKGDISPEDLGVINAKKVGVFVNQPLDEVAETIESYGLDYAQLHGDESVEYCWSIKSMGISVIKAFAVSDRLPLNDMRPYEAVIDMFLLDTSGSKYGGNGVKFDWKALEDYEFKIPFMLSGGIEPGDEIELKKLNIEQLFGFDVNSRFELSPGIKDGKAVREFVNAIRQ